MRRLPPLDILRNPGLPVQERLGTLALLDLGNEAVFEQVLAPLFGAERTNARPHGRLRDGFILAPGNAGVIQELSSAARQMQFNLRYSF